MAQNKPLVIDADITPNGTLNEWSTLPNKDNFIRQIQTPALTENSNIAALVSGIPTAFARVDLFSDALANAAAGAKEGNTARNLAGYYTDLVNEWKGFIACLALDYTNIQVKRITLAYSDGKGVAETANVYEPAGAFGNMLLERRLRWSEQNLPKNVTAVPFINVIKYCGRVVGAAAPESLLFTSSGYYVENASDRPWVDVATHRFTDPLRSNLSINQTATLHAYVAHIMANLPKVEAYYANLPNDLKLDYSSVRSVLQKWSEEIENYAHNHGYNLSVASTPPVDASFAGPFADLFNYKDELWGCEGQIAETKINDNFVSFDPKKLLLPADSRIARIILSPEYTVDPSKLKNLPLYILPARVKGQNDYAFFALPISAAGLNIYGKTVGALVGVAAPGTELRSKLEAVYHPEFSDNNLEVTLVIRTEGNKERRYSQSYTVGNENAIQHQDILLWPNFISRQWNRYFMYSELPHNSTAQTYRAYPFVGNAADDSFRILVDSEKKPILLAKGGEIVKDPAYENIKAKLLVSATSTVTGQAYLYEIYESNLPFKGVRLKSPTGKEGGYLIINYSSDKDSHLPHDLLTSMRPLEEVSLGVDFGSTNTSIAYSTAGGPEGFSFSNQRVSLLGKEQPINGKTPPMPNQVLFFQGRPTPVPSNAIKSILTLHDERRLETANNETERVTRMETEVVGGFPCFVDDRPIKEVSQDHIVLEYPLIGRIEQVHNMKWTDNATDRAYKEAFLKTLMLQVYAELFMKEKVPVNLRWSYPSSMSQALLNKYRMIWDSLSSISPVNRPNSTESYKLSISQPSTGISIGSGFGDGNNTSGGFGGTETSGGFGSFGGGMASGGFGSFGGANGGQSSGGFGSQSAGGLGGFGGADNDQSSGGFGSQSSGGFGGFGGADNGQASGGFGGGFGGVNSLNSNKPQRPDLKPDDPNRVVKYEPQPLFNGTSNPSLTEATSVANFTSGKYGTKANQLTLCFDIGGSTTDISALYLLRDGVTMIKQNSLRFAAQRVSHSVSRIPQFENILQRVCHDYGISMLGLNNGQPRYSAETATYYFDQIVERLNNEQLIQFYKRIAADCPQLMMVNMYVTGLLMYYAGQVANKLVNDIAHVDPSETIPGPKPRVLVTFAGKGSRLMQWLGAVDPGFSKGYYETLFMQGFGGKDAFFSTLGDCKLELPDDSAVEVKYEVSKGLAKGETKLFEPKERTDAEIVGESRFAIVQLDNQLVELDSTNTITPEMIEHIGIYFSPNDDSNPCPRFVDFCGTFYNATNQAFAHKISPEVFMQGCRDINIVQYVQNMPEFNRAKKEAAESNGKFDFVAPIIILEGMKFYESTLLKILQ